MFTSAVNIISKCDPFTKDMSSTSSARLSSSSSSSLIEIGIHSLDISQNILKHLIHLKFVDVIAKDSGTRYKDEEDDEQSLYLFKRSFYCSDRLETNVLASKYYERCQTYTKKNNLLNVGIVLRIYDHDDSGKLSSVISGNGDGDDGSRMGGSGSEYDYVRKITYQHDMRLKWIDWKGRRWRVPLKEKNKF